MNKVTKIDPDVLMDRAKRWRVDRMLKIKQHGKLIGMRDTWQYWAYNDAVYAVPTDGDADRVTIWCALSVFKNHLIDHARITGKRWEDTILVINKSLIPQY